MPKMEFNVVKLACEELIKQSEKDTGDKVLLKTGESKSTVVKKLREWRDKVEQQQSLMAENTGYSTEFLQAVNRETNRYTTETKKRFIDIIELAKSSESFAITALQESENENVDLTMLIDNLRNQLQDKDDEITSLSQSLEQALSTAAKSEVKIEDNDAYLEKTVGCWRLF